MHHWRSWLCSPRHLCAGSRFPRRLPCQARVSRWSSPRARSCPTDASLAQYRYPDWFRDAKFGIWAHWGPQSVPDVRRLVRAATCTGRDTSSTSTTSRHYGHPSKFGYKDVIPLWKAERWDPDRLMALYKKAGARYFVSMGVHHDNFDLWDSKYHRWNAVQMGPHRDVVGEWQKAARSRGCRSASPSTSARASPGGRAATARQDRPARRRALRRRRPAYWQDLYHPPRGAGRQGRVVQHEPRAGTASGSRASRTSWTTTSPTCSTRTAACRSATRSGAA